MDGPERREFHHGGEAVGIFTGEYPRAAGPCRYMPYRGPGHYDMQEALRARGFACCHYELDGERVYFAVVDCPEYGVLELTDVSRGTPPDRCGPYRGRGPDSTSTE